MNNFIKFLIESKNINDAIDILKRAIAGSEYEYRLYIAGGAIRDELLGKEIKDIDIVVDGPPESGMDAATFIAKKLGVYKQDSNPVLYPTYGTAKISFPVNGEMIDVEFVAPRKEKYIEGSRKPIVYAGTLEDDAKRRDFTVNSLFKNLTTNEIYDLTGRGIKDLDSKVLNTTGDPDWIFSEDPLRILRAIRFALKYDFKLPMVVIRAIKRAAPSLKNISKERIQDELNKILVLDKPSRAIRLFKITNILNEVLPEFNGLIKLKQNKYHTKDAFGHTLDVLDNTPPELIRRLSALFHDLGKISTRTENGEKIQFIGHADVSYELAKVILKRLKYPNDIIEKVAGISKYHMDLKGAGKEAETLKDSTLRKFIFRVADNLEPLLDVIHADNISHASEASMPKQIDIIRSKIADMDIESILNTKSILDGNEIRELGAEGKQIGEIKQRILTKVLENPEFTREQAINLVKNTLNSKKKLNEDFKGWMSPSGKIHLFPSHSEHALNLHPEYLEKNEPVPRSTFDFYSYQIKQLQKKGFIRFGKSQNSAHGTHVFIHYDGRYPNIDKLALKLLKELALDPEDEVAISDRAGNLFDKKNRENLTDRIFTTKEAMRFLYNKIKNPKEKTMAATSSLTEAAFHDYPEWGWIKPDGTLLSSVSTPKVKKFIAQDNSNFYYKKYGAIHYDIIEKFSDYSKKYLNKKITKEISEKIQMKALEDGWIRYFIETNSDQVNYLYLDFRTSNINIHKVVNAISKIITPYKNIWFSREYGRILKTNSSLKSIKIALEKMTKETW